MLPNLHPPNSQRLLSMHGRASARARACGRLDHTEVALFHFRGVWGSGPDNGTMSHWRMPAECTAQCVDAPPSTAEPKNLTSGHALVEEKLPETCEKAIKDLCKKAPCVASAASILKVAMASRRVGANAATSRPEHTQHHEVVHRAEFRSLILAHQPPGK